MSNDYDIYDLVLQYLLDEGYAETVESAEVMMAHMSDDWRESIIEAYVPWDFGPRQKSKAKYDQLVARKKKEQESGIKGGRGTATRANKLAKNAVEMRRTLDKDSEHTGADPKKQGLQPSTERHTDAARRRAAKGMASSMTARKYYG
jgi:hypothetical protein